MKTQIKLLLLTLVLAGSAHADITDLTPGGTAIDYGPPAVVQINGFYDSAAFGYFDNGPNSEIFLNGWVS
jgi:hypothetical protein